MGLFSSLFGGKKSINVTKILQSIKENGGQGIVDAPIEVFAKYLQENGEQQPSHAGVVTGFLNVDGKRCKVGFQHGVLQGLQKGETIITVFSNSGIEGVIDKIGLESLAVELYSLITKFISNEDDAYTIAYQMIVQSNMIYNKAYLAKGEHKIANKDNYPALLKEFTNEVNIDGYLKEEYQDLSPDLDFFEINDVFDSLTRDISDPELQLKLNYAIVENIIRECHMKGWVLF